MQMSRPPRISTVEVVGLVTAFASAPILKGAMSTIATNGADSAKKSHSDVSDTTLTPAIFNTEQAITTARAGNIQHGTGNHHRQCNTPSAICLLEPREHAGQVKDKQCGIDRHIENGRHQREPGFLKSPEISHGAAHPGVVAAFVRQRARKLADHEGGYY